MVKVKGFFEKAYLFVILAILYAPIILIIVYSFSNSSNFRFDEGFTFQAYISIFTSDKSISIRQNFQNSICCSSAVQLLNIGSVFLLL